MAAGVLLFRQQLDAAFVLATLGIVAWFLSYRVQMKRIISESDNQNTSGEDTNDETDN